MRGVAALVLGFVLIFVLSSVSALHAQSVNASVTGQVTDPSKAIMPNVEVTLINTATNLRYESATNQTGTYYITNIPPGTYRMQVEKVGFMTVIKPDIILHVQDALEINFEMELGSVSESITVTGGAPALQLTTSSISGVANSTTVRELPLNGRD